MKYIIRAIISIALLFAMVACNNEGETKEIRKYITDYTALSIYQGSGQGAKPVTIEIDEEKDKNEEYSMLVRYTYFPTKGDELLKANQLSFEFLDNGILTFTDKNAGRIIVSNYTIEENSLYIMRDGKDKQLVAHSEDDGETYYRIKSVWRKIRYAVGEDGKQTKVEDKTEVVDDTVLDLQTVLGYAEIENETDLKNEKDTLMWCNVKYIYK